MPLILPDGPLTSDNVSDGYHTFGELYEHRIVLFLALTRTVQMGWKSQHHSDGTSYPGWFIAGLTLPTGEITYHLPMAYWEEATQLRALDKAPSWDGHAPSDVVQRLRLFASLEDQ